MQSSLGGRHFGPSRERLLLTEKTFEKRDGGSHSQDRWSASLRYQHSNQLTNSVPQIISQLPAASVKETKPEANRNIKYSFQQYQDKNYDFIHKRIGSDDEGDRTDQSNGMLQSRKTS